MDEILARVVVHQVEQYDQYDWSGVVEGLERRVDSLTEAVGALSALLVAHTAVSVDDLDEHFPSWGGATIKSDLEKAQAREQEQYDWGAEEE